MDPHCEKKEHELGGEEWRNAKLPRSSLIVDQFLQSLRLSEPIKEAFLLLQHGNVQRLAYHNMKHTAEVMATAIELAAEEGVDTKDLELLAIAAAFHDTGFTVTSVKNECYGAAFARSALLRAGFTDDDIMTVVGLIEATELILDPTNSFMIQRASTPLANFLLDADLANLGKSDFLKYTGRMVREQFAVPPTTLSADDIRSYLQATEKLITHHRWKTVAGTARFEQQRQLNVERIGKLLESLEDLLE